MIERDVDHDGSEDGQREIDEPTRKQQQAADEFQYLYDREKSRHVNRTHEGCCVGIRGRLGDGHELQPEVEAEDDKDEAEQVAGDGGGEFHGVDCGGLSVFRDLDPLTFTGRSHSTNAASLG